MRRAGVGGATLFTDRLDKSGFPIETTVEAYLREQTLGVLYNLFVCQPKIDGVRATMVRELEIAPNEIVEVPALFEFDPATTRAIAQTANTANVQVVVARGVSHVLVSRPFGPQVVLPAGTIDVFEFYLDRVLSGLGNTVRFIDDWYAYHLFHGNVHCGTNVLRDQRDDVRWWQMEWVV